MLKAAIDIGSNSVRLLVADVNGDEFKPLFKRINTTRLHEGLSENGMLFGEPAQRTRAAIADFARQARNAGVSGENIRAFATSAVRDAENGGDFIKDVRGECGVNIRLLTGQQEARCAFFAAALPGGECGVIDIGGASTEMICGSGADVRAAYSAQMGAVRLRKMLGGDNSVERMLETSAQVLRPGIDAVSPLPNKFVGVAGTITTLYALKIGLAVYDPDRIQGGWLSRDEVEKQLYTLNALSVEERRKLPGMPERRAEIIDYGAAILVSFLRMAGLEGLYVSDRDNLYSAVMMELNG